MDNSNTFNEAESTVISRKAWTAYIKPVCIILFLVYLSVAVNILLGLAAVAYSVYAVLEIRSYRLYTNDDGVWIYSGVFPWNKGFRGVKWRDLDEAVYYTGFLSWALKSYTVKISHRFTKDSEIMLSHMKMGDSAVKAINSEHKQNIAQSESV